MYQKYIKLPHSPQEWRINRLDTMLTSPTLARLNNHMCMAQHLHNQIDNLYSAFMHIISMHKIYSKNVGHSNHTSTRTR